ncbi:hypothetical protein TNCV_1465781 [Trichonephila clavipes]|nr:hypothetical protein TNCV_1465781 [Trichonephila clavipes]
MSVWAPWVPTWVVSIKITKKHDLGTGVENSIKLRRVNMIPRRLVNARQRELGISSRLPKTKACSCSVWVSHDRNVLWGDVMSTQFLDDLINIKITGGPLQVPGDAIFFLSARQCLQIVSLRSLTSTSKWAIAEKELLKAITSSLGFAFLALPLLGDLEVRLHLTGVVNSLLTSISLLDLQRRGGFWQPLP